MNQAPVLPSRTVEHNIHPSILEAIAQQVKIVKEWSPQQQREYWTDILGKLSRKGLPNEMHAIADRDFRIKLMHDREFAELCDIRYSEISDHLDVILIGAAKYCAETYLNKGDY